MPSDSVLHVATRVRGGVLATLAFPDHRLSPGLGDVLMSALRSAREAGPCPHLKPGGGWVLLVAAARVMCVPCAFEPEAAPSWQKGAPCSVCGFAIANLTIYDFWADGEDLGVTRMITCLCPDCVRVETGAEVRP